MTENKKYIVRTPEEKERIIFEYYSGNIGHNALCRKYGLSTRTLRSWRNKYEAGGIKNLRYNGGRKKVNIRPPTPKTYEEELELKIMKLEIENARLKKGYLVKGDGAQKEYVTTLD